MQQPERALHAARVVDHLLGRHDVEPYAEVGEVAILLDALHPKREDTTAPHALLFRQVGEPGSLEVEHFAGALLEVLPVVPALGDRGRMSGQLPHAGPEALRHPVDLDAGVIDVELTRDTVAGPLEQRRDGVAQRGAAAVAHVQRAGGIGGDEFHIDVEHGAGGASAEGGALLEDGLVRRRQLVLCQPEVDEAGARDLRARHEGRGSLELLEHALGRLPGIGALPFGEHHGEVGREVAVAGVAGPLEHELHTVGAESRGYPRQLGAKHVAHSETAFLAGLDSAFVSLLAAGLASAFAGSDFASAAGFSDSAFRGPLPSLP